MAVGEQADEETVNERFLSDDDVGDFSAEFDDPLGGVSDLVFQRGVHVAGI